MDEVLDKLESTVITPEAADERQNSYQALYKNWGRLGNQEERRREILELQKTNRNDKIDAFRGILELVKVVEEKDIFKPYNRCFSIKKAVCCRCSSNFVVKRALLRTQKPPLILLTKADKSCSTAALPLLAGVLSADLEVHYRPSIYVAGFHKASVTYNNVLMLSEWMIEKPADFNENWYIVPCPKGVRMLVVASQGTTRAYTKYGHFRHEFRSALPGGNPCEPVKNRCCVLDCFYSEPQKTMYILDLLAWNNQPMTDGETEFRQYWLKSQLTELPQLTTITKKNKMVFQLLPMVSCTRESLNHFMMTYPQFPDNVPALDGLLLYHKKAHYVSGETPLVGWLYPYMVPEVLGSEITVHPQYMNAKPPGYKNQAEFIQAFEAKQDKRKPKSRRTSNSMDTSDSKETEAVKSPTQSKTENKTRVPESMEEEEKPSKNENEPVAPESMEEEKASKNENEPVAPESMEEEKPLKNENEPVASESMEEEKPLKNENEAAVPESMEEEKPATVEDKMEPEPVASNKIEKLEE